MESHLGLVLEHSWDLLDGSIDGSNYGKFEGLFLGGSLGSTDGKVLSSDEIFKPGSADSKVLGIKLGNLIESHLGLMLEQSDNAVRTYIRTHKFHNSNIVNMTGE